MAQSRWVCPMSSGPCTAGGRVGGDGMSALAGGGAVRGPDAREVEARMAASPQVQQGKTTLQDTEKNIRDVIRPGLDKGQSEMKEVRERITELKSLVSQLRGSDTSGGVSASASASGSANASAGAGVGVGVGASSTVADDVKRLDEEIAANVEHLQHLRGHQAELTRDLQKQRQQVSSSHATDEATREAVARRIMEQAHIVLCTLNGAGHETVGGTSHGFRTVIVDEACQAVEVACLVPLQFDARRCVLVGDPQQLPPTVLSAAAAKMQYTQSLFARMQTAGVVPTLLQTQYRMHPLIRAFPSDYFYRGLLNDGNPLTDYIKPWHQRGSFGPVVFFDTSACSNAMERRGGGGGESGRRRRRWGCVCV